MWRSPPDDRPVATPTPDPGAQARTDVERAIAVIPGAAYVCDEAGRITAYNTPAAKLWRRESTLRDPVERYCGASRMFTRDGKPVAHEHCWMARALAEGADCCGQSIVIEQPGGNRIDAVAHARILRDSSGRITGAVGLMVDISAVRRDAQRKDEFLAMLGHDLRNPLGPIRNAMHILRARGRDEKSLWAIELVERQVDELVTVIDAACEISSMSRGLVNATDAPFRIADAVREAAAASGPMLARRQQTCRIELPRQSDQTHGDRKRTEQAVRTMVRCVSRALPSGAAVALRAAMRDGRWTISAGPADANGVHAEGRGERLQHTPPTSVGLMLLRALAGLLGATITVRPAGAEAFEYEVALRA